jgi:hypothetical protein
MEVNGTHQLLVYANDVNLLAVNANSIKKTAGALFEACKEVGLEVNAKEATCMCMSSDQNAD